MNPSNVQSLRRPSHHEHASLALDQLSISWRLWLLIGLWITLLIYSFWYFELRLIRPYSQTDSQTNSQANPQILSAPWFEGEKMDFNEIGFTSDNIITIINIIDPNCPCSSYSQTHIQQLQQQLQAKHIRFYWLYSENPNQLVSSNTQKGFSLAQVNKHDSIQFADVSSPVISGVTFNQYIEASPAVIVLQGSELAYFGPYSSGFFCGSGKSFVNSAVQQLQQGHNPKLVNTGAIGCFCDWPNSDTV